jgi:hypothetical protein
MDGLIASAADELEELESSAHFSKRQREEGLDAEEETVALGALLALALALDGPAASGDASGRTAAKAAVSTPTKAKRQRRASTLYRFSRRELAVTLFSHLAHGHGSLSATVLEILRSEGWSECAVGGSLTLDVNAVSKGTLMRVCDSMGLQPRSGRNPQLSARRRAAAAPADPKLVASAALHAEAAARGGITGDEEPPYCLCGSEFTYPKMIACSGGAKARCHGWVHPECTGMDEAAVQLAESEPFTCLLCSNAAEGRHVDLVIADAEKQSASEGDGEGQAQSRDHGQACAFCGFTEESDPLLGGLVGPFLPAANDPVAVASVAAGRGRGQLWCHSLCAAASDSAGMTPDGMWYNVSAAAAAARSVSCRICDRPGASVRSQRKGAVTPGWAHLHCVFAHGKNKTVRAIRRQLEREPPLPRSSPERKRAEEARSDERMALMDELRCSLVYSKTAYEGVSAIRNASFSDEDDGPA